ncbi:DUF1127 domain-containing protein [Phyllobacterium endophyticum]|uniref:YjiS-like domain-containing protein n=1 Tax=Phyllobacterium endophyticum TaxID=1149773 RepID=A0A2P7B1H6_9HYPH|nr:DUF1127 domain-containing protein [Phyllobacterium endophyticum]MBB3237869.1 uncharacterized protein YjiS (DUF1127 family) [Phyllobacterium endophyticum]PSH60302.1 hypothetical protein CU100_06335 [Phyllobacterium endophyticum]TXR48155.1 DUF1127 domain-containing protein [Phyllobacterium endophyticum]TYR42476.1 DUF1127 domain-containing protein [Phyllobacterium endophyticum]
MAHSETTGLLEFDRNYWARRGLSSRDRSRTVLLQGVADYIRSVFATRLSARTKDAPLANLSDRMLEDIGISRAQAIELDGRRSKAGE